MTIRIGIIGAGVVAAKHANAYRQNPHCQIVAVSENVVGKGRAFAQTYNAEFFADYHDLLKRAEVDAVSICLPHHLHHTSGMMAANSGVHILMEKPLTLTIAEANELIAACAKRQLRLMTGFVHRFRGEMLAAERLIRDGRIGKPCSVIDNFCSLGGKHPPQWVWQKQLAGGGVLMYGGVHGVDRVRWLMGSEVVEVFARKITYSYATDCEDGLIANLQFANGAIGCLFENSPSYGKPGGWHTDIYGEQGAIRLRHGEWLEFTAENEQYTQTFHSYDHFQREIDEFVAAILEKREPWITGHDGRQNLAIVQAIYESAETGQVVRL